MNTVEIVIGQRCRKAIERIETLVMSIRQVGLLHPVVVNSRNELVAGFRRLEAVKRLGWDRVPVRVVETLDDAVLALRAERDENACREPLTPMEMLEIGRAVEGIEAPKAKERQKEGGKAGGKACGKLPQASVEKTRDKVAAAVGVSGKTYEKAKQVAAAAEKEPDKFGDLPAKMEAESIDAAHKELKARTKPPSAPVPPAPPKTEKTGPSVLLDACEVILSRVVDDRVVLGPDEIAMLRMAVLAAKVCG